MKKLTIYTDEEESIDVALARLTDEFIDSGKHCDATVIDLRDACISLRDELAQKSNHMGLRDHFAAMALQGFASQPDGRVYSCRGAERENMSVEEWQAALFMDDARVCYRMADAMLKVREEATHA